MATVIVNNPVGSGVVYANQFTSVWVKAYHGSTWRYVPYLFPENSVRATAPSDSEGTLSWNYGKYVNLWGDGSGTLLPISLENWHVAILVHTIYGTYLAWTGVVVGESLVEKGIDVATGLPRGDQTIECRGPEFLLERRAVIGTYVGDRERLVYLPKTRIFNDTSSRRESLAGNRSAQLNEISGTYVFSSDGNKWSNYDIIKYLLAAFQPWYPFQGSDGAVGYAPEFYLVGQTAGLKYIFEEHRLEGRTIREALNSLIDRKRGFGWYIETDGVGPYYIVVFSLSQFPVVGNQTYVPANPRQVDIPIHDDKWIEARYRIVSTSQVDQIVVEGEPIKTCATIRFSNGTLEPAWQPDLDSDFYGLEPNHWALLAQDILTNFDSINLNNDGLLTPLAGTTKYGFISAGELFLHAGAHPELFAFLSDPMDAFGILDTDGDGKISKEDLGYLIPDVTYQVATAEARATDKYSAVFSHFQVPKQWNWAGWAPYVRSDGSVDLSGSGTYWNSDHAPLRHLPFMEPGYAPGVEREYLEPFAIIAKPSRMRDIVLALANANFAPYMALTGALGAQVVVPDMTQAEFDAIGGGGGHIIGWPELTAAILLYPYEWIQLDHTQEHGYPTCSLRMGDSGLKIIVKSETNHVFAKNHIADSAVPSNKPTVFDYVDLAATIFFETDMMARVVLPVWNNIYRDKNGDITYQASPIGKQIYVQVPGKEVWIAAPNTVTGLNGTALVYFREGVGGIIRDDTEDLQVIAKLARIWYGQQRASIDMTIKNQLPWLQLGDLVRSTRSGRSFERVGTCVTAIHRNYQAGTQEISTGYGELDPAAFGSKHG